MEKTELTKLFSIVPDMVCIADADGYFKYLNPEWEKTLGFTLTELLSRPLLEFIHPDDREPTRREIQRQLNGKKTLGFENRYRCKDGSYRLLEWRATPAEQGRLYAVARDITERRLTRNGFKQSEMRFRNLIEGSIQGILIHRDHKPLFVNRAWASIYGYTIEEIMGMDSIVQLISPNDQQRMIQYRKARMQGEEAPSHYEYQGIRKDGSPIWLENRVMIVDWDGEPAVQTIIVDITERKRVEENLRESEEKYRILFESSKEANYIITAQGRLVFANRSFFELFGYSPAEKSDFNALHIYADPNERPRLTTEIEEKGFVKDFELKMCKRDGTRMDCLVTATIRRSKEGGVAAYQGIIRDVTELKKKQAEREKLIAELQAALAEVKTLSGLLPICSICNKIKDDNGYWNQIEAYIQEHSYAQFSHSICKECANKHYPGMRLYDD